MNSKKYLTIFLTLLVLVTTIGCDQASKHIVRKHLSYSETIALISNYFTLTRIENKGAFLSLGDSLADPLRFLFLSVLPMLALFFGLLFLFINSRLTGTTRLGLCFFIGGGIGNIYDRIVHGSVTDFLHIDLGIVQTGIFNMADVSIMFGMMILLINFFRSDELTWKN